MKTLIIALTATLFLTGCPGTVKVDQTPKDPIFIGTQVKVPVREACHVTIPDEPKWAVDAVAPDASTFEKSKAVLAELVQRVDYQAQLLAASKQCE